MPSITNLIADIETMIRRAEKAALAERTARGRKNHEHLLAEVKTLAHTDPHDPIPVRVLMKQPVAESGSPGSDEA